MLDNTVVVWMNELGLGPINNHSRLDQHVLLAGGGNAGLKLGHYVNLGGVGYHHLLLTLVHALGHTEVTRFGEEGTIVLPDFFA
jgi:hypothetical protein